MAQARMRTIKKAIQTLNSEDNGNCITEYYLRKLVKKGTIKTITIGNRKYLDLNEVQEYINSLFNV